MAQNKNATTAAEMGKTHRLLNHVINKQLSKRERIPVTDLETGEFLRDDDGELVCEEEFVATPQLINAAINFLKNNGIEAPEEAEEVKKTADELAERRKQAQQRRDRIRSGMEAAARE